MLLLFQDSASPEAQSFFWQVWLATVQEVLQADWQEVWHSPQPAPAALRQADWMVLICFTIIPSLYHIDWGGSAASYSF